MCTFLFFLTKTELDPGIIKVMEDAHNFTLSHLNHDLQSGFISFPHIYKIHRQCACDFFKPSNLSNNSGEIKTIVSDEVKKNGDVILIKSEKELLQETFSNSQNQCIDLYKFLILYPSFMEFEVAYKISEVVE